MYDSVEARLNTKNREELKLSKIVGNGDLNFNENCQSGFLRQPCWLGISRISQSVIRPGPGEFFESLFGFSQLFVLFGNFSLAGFYLLLQGFDLALFGHECTSVVVDNKAGVVNRLDSHWLRLQILFLGYSLYRMPSWGKP